MKILLLAYSGGGEFAWERAPPPSPTGCSKFWGKGREKLPKFGTPPPELIPEYASVYLFSEECPLVRCYANYSLLFTHKTVVCIKQEVPHWV